MKLPIRTAVQPIKSPKYVAANLQMSYSLSEQVKRYCRDTREVDYRGSSDAGLMSPGPVVQVLTVAVKHQRL